MHRPKLNHSELQPETKRQIEIRSIECCFEDSKKGMNKIQEMQQTPISLPDVTRAPKHLNISAQNCNSATFFVVVLGVMEQGVKSSRGTHPQGEAHNASGAVRAELVG